MRSKNDINFQLNPLSSVYILFLPIERALKIFRVRIQNVESLAGDLNSIIVSGSLDSRQRRWLREESTEVV